MARGNTYPWLSAPLERIVGIGLHEAALSRMIETVRRVCRQHESCVVRHGMQVSSPIAAMLVGEEHQMMSGVKFHVPPGTDLKTVTPDTVFQRMKATFVDVTDVDATKNAATLTRKMLEEGFYSLSGIPRIELHRGPNQLVRDIVSLVDDSVRVRNLILLPFLTVGTCQCCQSDDRIGLMQSLVTRGPQLETSETVRTKRTDALFDKIDTVMKSKRSKVYAERLLLIAKHVDATVPPGSEDHNLLYLMAPQIDTVLQGIGCHRVAKDGTTKWDIRLACTGCLSRLNDPKMFRIGIDNARFIEAYLTPRIGQEGHEVRRTLVKRARAFEKKLKALEKAESAARQIGASEILIVQPDDVGMRNPSEHDIDAICRDLIDRGFEDMVANHRKAKSELLKLKKKVTIAQARSTLETASSFVNVGDMFADVVPVEVISTGEIGLPSGDPALHVEQDPIRILLGDDFNVGYHGELVTNAQHRKNVVRDFSKEQLRTFVERHQPVPKSMTKAMLVDVLAEIAVRNGGEEE